MQSEETKQKKTNITSTFFLILVLVILVYSNSFTASWHLDDEPNIIQNSNLQIGSIDFTSLKKIFFAHPIDNDQLYRPVVCFTFALNWYFGKTNVIGFRVVNVAIHFLCSFILFLTINALFNSPRLKLKYEKSTYFIALLGASFWALNPIQTQAVTYIVQRMSSLAGLFYLMGILFYLKTRNIDKTSCKWFNGILCILSYLLALGCKENTVVLPFSLLLIEMIFYQGLANLQKKRILFTGAGFLLIVCSISLLFVFNNDAISIFSGYHDRSFTLAQRLLTEPRVIIFYLTQLFYPVPGNLSIEHDFVVSRSLFDPWTTFAAIVFIISVTLLSILKSKKYPLSAFAILFFFLNHIVESSFIPLELIFEHRNYIPSFFLFVPIVTFLKYIIDSYNQKKKYMAKLIISFTIFLTIGIGIGTYTRNISWATEKSLWQDAMRKAPGRARPVYVLAQHYLNNGEIEKALAMYNKALKLESSTPQYTRALAQNGIAATHYMKGEYEKAITFSQKALQNRPEFGEFRYNMILSLLMLEDWDQAIQNIDMILLNHPENIKYLYMKGMTLLKKGKPQKALTYFRSVLKNQPEHKSVKIKIAEALNMMGEQKQADIFLNVVTLNLRKNIDALIFLLDNSIRDQRILDAEKYIDIIVESYPLDFVIEKIKGATKRYSSSLQLRIATLDLLRKQMFKISNEFKLADQ